MNVENLHDLFVSELHRLYAIESKLVDELETLEQDTDVDALDDLHETDAREALERELAEHMTETETHVERLEKALDALGQKPESRSTPALDGLIKEKEMFNNVVLADEIRPVYYLGASEQIENLEITAYERLIAIGNYLNVDADVIDLLEQNLEEDRSTLESLESLSEGTEFEQLLDGLSATLADD